MIIRAELSADGKAIDVHFPYSPQAVASVKEIPGRRFVPKDKGGPFWRVPLDLATGRRLREHFGAHLHLGPRLREWGLAERDKQRNLGSIAKNDDYPLASMHLADAHGSLAQYLRPYQRADVAMMGIANVLNGNQMGLGKTVEVIAALVESKLHLAGPHLVLAPKTSHETVWKDEFNKWLPQLPVVIYSGDLKPKEREAAQIELNGYLSSYTPFVLVTNVHAVRAGKPIDFTQWQWASVTIDEFHKSGMTNASGASDKGSKLSQVMKKVPAKRKFALSGTPMGGQPIKLWGVLHWIEPQEYTSKWRWADQWLEVTDNGFGKEIGGLKRDREDEFYAYHARHMVRRLKREVMPQLPRAIHKDMPVDMTPGQRKQYEQFARDAEIRINDERLSARGVLAEYTRLKQFANAKQHLVDGQPMPTEDSPKLEPLLDKLDEQGIRPEDAVVGEVALVGTESKRFADMVAAWLSKQGLKVEVITGATKAEDRNRIVRAVNGDPEQRPQVVVMTTTAGGMSVNLQPANAVHVLDETWNPDDQAQLIERADRGSRTEPLMVFWWRTKDTVQEAIHDVTEGKAVTNDNVLDVRRAIFRNASKGKEAVAS